MIARNNRMALFALLALILGFAAVTFTGCPTVDDDDSAADDDSAPADDDDSAVTHDDDSAE